MVLAGVILVMILGACGVSHAFLVLKPKSNGQEVTGKALAIQTFYFLLMQLFVLPLTSLGLIWIAFPSLRNIF